MRCDDCIHQHVCFFYKRIVEIMNDTNGFGKKACELLQLDVCHCIDFETYPDDVGSDHNQS